MDGMIDGFRAEFLLYKQTGEKALAQVSDEALNRIPSTEGNSMAMIVRHISGNFVSRFTDFLTSDGEKPWRKRDTEFETRSYARAEVEELWRRGWDVLLAQIGTLAEHDLAKIVTIRGRTITVHQALIRSIAHVAYHVGQIVLLARVSSESPWQWITIPKGMSEAYNQAPSREARPTR